MIRKLLILVFAVSVVGNALAAAAQVGMDECGACCAPNSNKASMSPSKECCYSECGLPRNTQPITPKSVLGLERIHKLDAPTAVILGTPFEKPSSEGLRFSTRRVIQTTHIYLRTGTLLI